jgi:cob(I)alamin adenosyltransferase
VIRYLNRLSDWLFMVARFASKQSGAEEIIWK